LRKTIVAVLFSFFFSACWVQARSEDLAGQVKKTIEKCTLDQPGTKPFHLKATYAPSFERDKDSHREGTIEIWWESPTRWRREVRSPDFHQVEIVDGPHSWQKNDGDYFPEWLRELAVAIVNPVPLPMDVLLQRVKSAEVKTLRMPSRANGQPSFNEQVNIDWEPTGLTGNVVANGKGHLALLNSQLFYTGGPGWDGQYHDFSNFHGRTIAHTISSGDVEVTAKVSLLEDLANEPAGLFDTTNTGGDAQLIDTAVLDESELRENLVSNERQFNWPPVTDGPFEGVVWTEVVIDRTGKIREMISPIADNPGMKDAAEQGFRAMQFKPFLRNGVPVQVTGRLSMRFKTTRPAGVETFDTARNYFARGRKVSFLAAGAKSPYLLNAEFQVATSTGVQTGRYEDTWISDTEWKREAWVGKSHFARSQVDDQHYLLTEGSDAPILRLVVMLLEPIPADDTMTESDWKVRRDAIDGAKAIRVYRGAELPNGDLDPKNSQAFWFDESGAFIKTYTNGLDVLPSQVVAYDGVQVARQVDVVKNGKLALRVSIKSIAPASPDRSKNFKMKGHEWQRAFTAEER
jgi:hypothetical protein